MEYRVAPGEPALLALRNPDDASWFDGEKKAGRNETKKLNRRLERLQELLYAEGKHKMLVVLQGLDTSGKDGTIRHVFEGTNPQGVKVANFKRPTAVELAHDYLWRVHRHTPGAGEITIFNRSHYEDVLAVRVHGLVPDEQWQRRYDHLVAFEQLLTDEGTTILKFFLHIDRDTQKQRLQARLETPHKQWKFSLGDLDERKRWDEYLEAYEEAISRTSTTFAPWFVIPANRKWYRNLVISRILVQTLEDLHMHYPEPEEGLEEIVVE